MTTRVGIIETWKELPEVERVFGTPAQSIQRYFDGQKGLSFVAVPASDGCPIPRRQDCDAFLITGSEHSVYNPLAWIPPMKDFVGEVLEYDIRLFGVCFGHQLMALEEGGTVEKSPKGRGIGIHQHDLTETGKRLLPGLDSIRLMAAHQDQVILPPPNARLLATSPFCQYAVFAYGTSGLSVQGHPEITQDFEYQIIQGWQERDPVDTQIVETALWSMENVECNTNAFRPFLTSFLTGELALG